MTRPDFTDAPCRANPDLHFPNTRGSRYLRQVAAAKAVCATCPLRKPCLQVAMTERDHHGRWYVGIWSGTSEVDRDELRRRRGAA